MVKVKVRGGLTFRMGSATSNQYGRLDVEIEVDADKPLEPQLELGKQAASKVWKVVAAELDREAEDLLSGRVPTN